MPQPVSFLLTVLFLLLTVLLTEPVVFAEDRIPWDAPAAEAALQNPTPNTPATLAVGQEVYGARCDRCHGESGAGDGKESWKLTVTPRELQDPAVQQQSDGALFWKIQTGRRPMPRYLNRLTAQEIWSVVRYLRALPSKR